MRSILIGMLLILSLAMVAHGQRPSTSRGEKTSAARNGKTTGSTAPTVEKTIRDGDTAVNLIFDNPRADVVSVFWVNDDGNEVAFGTIEAGAAMEPITTGPGHFWRFKASGKVVGTYRAGQAADQTFKIPTDPTSPAETGVPTVDASAPAAAPTGVNYALSVVNLDGAIWAYRIQVHTGETWICSDRLTWSRIAEPARNGVYALDLTPGNNGALSAMRIEQNSGETWNLNADGGPRQLVEPQ